MHYNLKGTNLELTNPNRNYVEKRIRPLDKFLSRKTSARLDIELEFLDGEEKKYRAEGTLHDHGLEGDFRAEATGSTLHEAIDLMTHEIGMELSRTKKRIIDDKRKGALLFKNIIRGFTDRF